MHGTHELRIAGAPSHASRDRQLIERRAHDVRQERGGGGSRLNTDMQQELAFLLGDPLQRFDGGSHAFGERDCRPGRVAARIERNV